MTMKLLDSGARDAELVDESEEDIDALHQKISDLRLELSLARRELAAATRQNATALSALRTQLQPLYRALQGVFGELDAAGIEDAGVTITPPSRTSAVWENWKSRLGVGPAKVIDALLLHGEMNTAQLAIATGYHRNTVPQYVSACNKAGLLNKNGGRFSLKQL